MNGLLECVFDGGKKKRRAVKKSLSGKGKKSSTSYCFKCSKLTSDKNAVQAGNTRDSVCSTCSTKRSVFIH